MPDRPRRRSLLAALALALAAAPALAATPLAALRYTPDTTLSLGGLAAGPADVVSDNLAGGRSLLPLPALPAGAGVAAYHQPDGSALQYFVFDTAVQLSAGLAAGPADVAAWDGLGWSLVFSGTSQGVPAGAAIDALADDGAGNLLMSFDTAVGLPGGVNVEQGDVVRRTAGGWEPVFSAAAAGVPDGIDLDGLHRLPNGHLLMSFDTAGSVGGASFEAGDVLEYTPGSSGTWEKVFDALAADAAWNGANLAALWAEPASASAAGTLQFSAPTYAVAENGGTATITVTRAGGTSGAVSVAYATANDTATAPADYAATSGTLGWAAGDGAPKTFSIPIMDDADIEGTETVRLALTAPTGGASLGSQATAMLSIVDDDVPANTPVLSLGTASLAFGSQAVGSASAPRTVSLTNTGTAPVTLASLTPGGTHAGDFALSGSCMALPTLAVGESCTMQGVFTPGAPGARSASIAVASNAFNNPVTVALSGVGTVGGAGGGGGGGSGSVTPVPILSPAGLALLAALTALCGLGAGNRRRGK